MRRMRELSAGQYIAIALPVLAAGFGVYYLVRHHHPAPAKKETASVLKPSQFEKESGKGSRKLASKDGGAGSDRGRSRMAKVDREADHESAGAADTAEGKYVAIEDNEHGAPKHARADHGKSGGSLEWVSKDAASAGGASPCLAIEYRGEGPKATKVTKGEWSTVMDQFHGAKHRLLEWIDKNEGDLGQSNAQAMAQQVRGLKIQRPPASDEPDLAWRGIGVFTQNSEGEPIVKVGGGFLRLSHSHPARAKFEMARLVAQALGPCELKRFGASEGTWSPLLKCLGVNESHGCGQGTYSEGGWAVSTTLAANVSNPDCRIEAFQSPDMAKCMAKIPTREIASADTAAPSATTGGHP